MSLKDVTYCVVILKCRKHLQYTIFLMSDTNVFSFCRHHIVLTGEVCHKLGRLQRQHEIPPVTAILLLLDRNNLNASKICMSNKIEYLIFYLTVNDVMIENVVQMDCSHPDDPTHTQCAKSE